MSKNLVIVESPAKAKTISGFLGEEFLVKSCFGHIRDLNKNNNAIDVENNFLPTYIVPEDKKKVVADLKKNSKSAKCVWLATDEDREGEAISWHLFEVLGLKKTNTKRIVFHEITKPAIQDAINNPRSIDKNLVDAQQARRILDRLVGFELSPLLWKKVKPSLSAGRVQSVAVRLIVEKERSIKGFSGQSYFKALSYFNLSADNPEAPPVVLKAELPEKISNIEKAREFLNSCIGATFTISNLETKPAKKSPSAPFTTSTLQQEASRKLGFSVSRTMLIAQRLYESGKITYMRTDSVNLSETALNAAKQEIISMYGNNYAHTRNYKTKSKSAQEAHEAIRPTYFNQHTVDGDASEVRLYDLIWKRAIASQMSEAQLDKTVATISISTNKEKLIANGEVLKFDGFLKVYFESVENENDDSIEEKSTSKMLPPLQIGQVLNLSEMNAIERFTQPPARYTEASLVKKLEELGIGRPSTYAPIISTIQKRGYVVKEDRIGQQRSYMIITLRDNQINSAENVETTGTEKSKLFPTDIGMVVNDFLVHNFKDIMDYNFTATVEKEFDEIASGNKVWNQMIAVFYKPFHINVDDVLKNAERATGERLLGVDPGSTKNIYARVGRFGPMVQKGETGDEEKPKFASLRGTQSIETITLQEALDLFKLPRTLGCFEDSEIVAATGRFGPYVKHNNKFYSLKKEDDPVTITNERAIELIQGKRKAEDEKIIKSFNTNNNIKVLNGKWGPYISYGDRNIKIPKGTEPNSLTLEDCVKLAETTPVSNKKRFYKKKKTGDS